MTNDRNTVLFLGDILCLALSFLLMIAIRFDRIFQADLIAAQTRLFVFLFALWLLIFFIFDLYNLRKVNPNPRTLGILALAVGVSAIVSTLFFYLFSIDGITPKTNLAIVAGVAFALLVGWRRLFYTLFARRYRQRIIVIGTGEAVEHLLSDLAQHPHIGTVVAVHPSYDVPLALPPAHTVIADKTSLSGLLHITQVTGAEVLSLSGAYEELFGKIPLSLMTNDRAISMLTRRHNSAYRLLERAIEIVVAVVILIVSTPIVLLAIGAILFEDGSPVMYKQSRVGKNGKLFSILKLRSMRKDAEAGGAQWAQKKDSRITRTGRILRKTHIDEIPQMLNVIRGDIALIGPRPERPEFVTALEKEIPYYFLRHTVKPGFTGWAQIKFRYARSDVDSREKFEYDLYYLAKKNPLFDLGILVKTLQIIFTH